MKGSMPRFSFRSIVFNLLLLLTSVLLTLVAAEAFYRWFKLRSTILTFTVSSTPLCEFDQEFGYRYIPNSTATTALIQNGSVVMFGQVTVDRFGNIGRGPSSWKRSDVKILAFGDSFTANPFSYYTWADYLPEDLARKLNKHVELMNFGRDGYGVLQMFHLANVMGRQFKPDLILITFISDDLSRARFWRTVKFINGQERLLVTIGPSADPDMRLAEDVTMINSSVNMQWCHAIVDSASRTDSVLIGLYAQFMSLAEDNYRASLSSLTTSFLFNRIVYRDPFHSIRKPSHNPRVDFQDFAADSSFVGDINSLKNQQIPILIIALPTNEDLKAGRYILSPQQEKLLESLQNLAGQRMVSLFNSLDDFGGNSESLFLLPYDFHPSKRGARVFAKAISKVASDLWPKLQHIQHEAAGQKD
jgi:hypothetical protein